MAFTPFKKGTSPKKPGFVDSEMPKGKKAPPAKKPTGKKPGY